MKNARIEGLEDIKVYLFGSALEKSNPEDIDILLVYDAERITINRALRIRDELHDYLALCLDRNADISLLSNREEVQTKFIETENAKEILIL
jgi:predicted nucleotidyltransferase